MSNVAGLFESLLGQKSPVIRLLDSATGDGVICVEDLLALTKLPEQGSEVSGVDMEAQVKKLIDRMEHWDAPNRTPRTQLSPHDLQRRLCASLSSALRDWK